MKSKALFIILNGLSLKQTKPTFLEGESPTLNIQGSIHKDACYKSFVNLNPLSAKFIKWSNTLKQIVGKLPTICLSVFDHFMNLALKGLIA